MLTLALLKHILVSCLASKDTSKNKNKMNFKVFAALFVTLLAVNVSQQNPIKDDSIKEIVVVVFNKILTVTKDLLDKVNADLSDFETNKDEIKSKILAFAIKEAEVVSKTIFELIDELNEGATDDGKAVLTCIDAEQGKVNSAIEVTAADIADCVAAEVDVAWPEVKTIVSQLGELQADSQTQVDTLSSCSDDELTCLVAFSQNAEAILKDVIETVKTDIDNIIALVKTIVNDVKSCDLKTHFKANVQEIFNEGVDCIKA